MEMDTEREASSFNDGGLWRKLLLKAKKGTTTEPYFVADIAEGCLHTNTFGKLGLPAVFLQHYNKNLTESIILEGPDGHKWPLMLGLSWEAKPCFINGWRELAAEYNLVVNDTILLFLWEDSHFLFQIFDDTHHIKRRGGSLHTRHSNYATTLNQQVEPVKSGCDNLRVKNAALSDNNSSTKCYKDHTTEAEPSPVEPGNQDGVQGKEEVSNEQSKALVPKLFSSSSALPSHVEEEEKFVTLKRFRRTLIPKTELGSERDEVYYSSYDRNGSENQKLDLAKETTPYGAAAASTKAKRGKKVCTHVAEEKTQRKRSQKLPAKNAKVGCGSFHNTKKVARKLEKASIDVDDAPHQMRKDITCEEHWDQTKMSSTIGKEPTTKVGSVPTPLIEETTKITFKRPRPRVFHSLPPIPLYTSKRRHITSQELEATMEFAMEYSRNSNNPNVVIQLQGIQVYCGLHLDVPPGFEEVLGLPPRARTGVTLYDQVGKTCETEWLGDHPKRPALHGSGWMTFVLEHCLEEGDVCVFERPDCNTFKIAVQIFPVVPLNPSCQHPWRSHYALPAGNAAAHPASPSVPHQDASLLLTTSTAMDTTTSIATPTDVPTVFDLGFKTPKKWCLAKKPVVQHSPGGGKTGEDLEAAPISQSEVERGICENGL